METRQILTFGGPKLRDPRYTVFDSAITRGTLHGHPGDEVLVITPDEAEKWRARLYADLPRDPNDWTPAHVIAYATFAGRKAILEKDVRHYVTRMQFATLEDREVDVASYFGLEVNTDGD